MAINIHEIRAKDETKEDARRETQKMKLLIATDLTPGSQKMIEVVINRPWPAGSEACVLHVVDESPFPLDADLLEMAREGAEATIKSIGERLGASGLKVRTEVLLGHPRSAVPEYAKKWGADFLIVGSHGGSGLARFLLGSVAQHVLRTAPCSVEVVRASAQNAPPARRGLKILLATDGSECSAAAIRSVSRRPWPKGTCVKLISVVSPFVPVADPATGFFYAGQALVAVEAVEKAARSRAAEAIAQGSEILSESAFGRIERSEPLMGSPKAVILEEAAEWGADMIVVGSHGWRGIDRLMMGSVSESVALHARCCVEVIR
jgi:nucleotide-binding universal stress UspA family protein